MTQRTNLLGGGSPAAPMLALALAAALAAGGATAALANGNGQAPAALPPGAEQAAAVIDAHTLRTPVAFLADDLLEGRGPATRGDQLTQQYLATTL